MENINQILQQSVWVIFQIIFLLSMFNFFKAFKLSKKSNLAFSIFSLVGIFFWNFFLICFIAKLIPGINITINTTKLAGLMFFFLMSAHTFCNYGMNTKHENLLKTALCLDGCTIIIYDFVILKPDLEFSTIWLCVINIAWIAILVVNIITIICLRKLTPYIYLRIHGNKYHVYNDLEPIFGKDSGGYYTITIPLIDRAYTEDNTLIKTSKDDENTYVISVNGKTYEIREDKIITVKDDGELYLITVTINQLPVVIRNTSMIDILI